MEIPYDCGGLFDYHLADAVIEQGYQLCLDALERFDAIGNLPDTHQTEELLENKPGIDEL